MGHSHTLGHQIRSPSVWVSQCVCGTATALVHLSMTRGDKMTQGVRLPSTKRRQVSLYSFGEIVWTTRPRCRNAIHSICITKIYDDEFSHFYPFRSPFAGYIVSLHRCITAEQTAAALLSIWNFISFSMVGRVDSLVVSVLVAHCAFEHQNHVT